MSLIVYSIPVFFLLIGIELLITKMKQLSYYRLNDAVTNLSCGITSQVAGVFLKTATFIGYTYLYNVTPLRVPDTILTGILLFLGIDFFYYWFHRLAHEISFLWGSHVVHHQSEEYNLTVALRQAALQGAFSWVFYLPLAVLGFSPAMFLTIAALQTLYQFWIHTKLIHKLPAPVEYIFNTPSHHRVHHGVNPKYIDRNHGGTLIIFDRMFGTFQEEEEEVVYGITKQPKSWNPVWLNFEYWIGLVQDIFRVRNIKLATLMLIKMPSWKPAELGRVEQPKTVTTQSFQKYNTELPAGLNYYVFFQFIMVLLGTTLFLNLEAKTPFNENVLLKISVALLIVFSLLNIGAIFERKSWVLLLEYLRIILTGVVIIFILKNISLFVIVAIVTAVLAVVSMVWFNRYSHEFNLKVN